MPNGPIIQSVTIVQQNTALGSWVSSHSPQDLCRFSPFTNRCYNAGLMDINELTQRMHQFVSAKGWYQPDTPKPQTLRNLAISLALEASEVLEHFQWGDNSPNQEDLAGELADVALYLLQISSLAGINLEKAILEKLAQNYQREWDENQLRDGHEAGTA
jgi:NTP pyrophosphatase (non-canonical NTP hydrolase)